MQVESTHRPRILVAEDDPAMRQLLVAALRWEGYHVVAARDGKELLERLGSAQLSHHTYDAIVSDVRMPGPNGLEVVWGLRSGHDSTPVILITAFGSNETHARALELGATAILDKPFLIESLLSLIADLVPSPRGGGRQGAGD